MTKVEQLRYNVLNRLKELFASIDAGAVIQGPEDGYPTWMLLTLHDNMGFENNEVMGEFYFMPLSEEKQKFHYFAIVLTLDENVPADRYEDLTKAAAMLNFYLPVGSFVLEKDGGVIAYKYTAILPWEMPEDELLSLADGGIGAALNLTDSYVDAFMKLMEKKITLEQFELELPDAHFA